MTTEVQVTPIKAFSDNYIWCIHNTNSCVVVDPGDAKPVLAHLHQCQLSLQGILITHHHWDHTDGINELLSHYPDIPVYGPENKISCISHRVSDQQHIQLAPLGISLQIIAVPGHTLDHIAYYGDVGLFCGDTLFSAGCGRLFEGTAKQMFHSLSRLKDLPDETKIYCTHEYTMSNLTFAQAVEPDNQALAQYILWARKQHQKHLPTLPTLLKTEKAINPFIRSQASQVKASAEHQFMTRLEDEVAVFAQLRQWKDKF